MSRILVCVHGACDHPPGFSDAWWSALRPYTQAFGQGILGETRLEVLWGDLIEHRGSGWFACTQDFLEYLYNEPVRLNVIKRFTDLVQPLLDAGHNLEVIGHSEGSVIAYEGLCECKVGMPTFWSSLGLVLNFFTPGSALGYAWNPLVPRSNVRDHLLPANQLGNKPPIVVGWWNIVAEGDPIASPLMPAYGVSLDYVGIPAFGCGNLQHDCAHSSYFTAGNVAVLRDIIAKRINNFS